MSPIGYPQTLPEARHSSPFPGDPSHTKEQRVNSEACTVHVGEHIEMQPATIWSILAIKNHALNLSNAAAESFEAAGHRQEGLHEGETTQ